MNDLSNEARITPRLPLLRWLADFGAGLSSNVRQTLYVQLTSSIFPVFIGSINCSGVALVGYFRTGDRNLLILMAIDLFMLPIRLCALRYPTRFPAAADFVFGGGLMWAMCMSATNVIVVLDGDPLMMVTVLGSSLGACGGILARNFAPHRYAIIQVAMIDLSFKATIGFLYPTFIPLLAFQAFIFMMMNVAVVKQIRKMTFRALESEFESRSQAFTDPLTGLLNRRGMIAEATAKQNHDDNQALLYLDLDGFKEVNDRYGHAAGDALLIEVARRLRVVTPTAIIARLGGDEFLMICPIENLNELQDIGTSLVIAIETPFLIEQGAFLCKIGVSIGATILEANEDIIKSALVKADSALYAAKGAGKGRLVVFDSEKEQVVSKLDVAVSA